MCTVYIGIYHVIAYIVTTKTAWRVINNEFCLITKVDDKTFPDAFDYLFVNTVKYNIGTPLSSSEKRFQSSQPDFVLQKYVFMRSGLRTSQDSNPFLSERL